MKPTPYTDDQILEALEKAFAFTGVNKFTTTNERLQIGKKFLELLPKPHPEPDPYATLKAYAKAGARIRFEDEFGWSEWAANEDWSWTQPPEEYQVHPADLHLLEVKPWTPKPGDVVQLKSGGPRMTCLLRHAHQDTYLCSWASEHGVFERFFPLACLQQA